MKFYSISAFFLAFIIIVPFVFTSIDALNDMDNAIELSENCMDDERESKEKKGDEEKLLSQNSFKVISYKKRIPSYMVTSEIHRSIKLEVLTPPPKVK